MHLRVRALLVLLLVTFASGALAWSANLGNGHSLHLKRVSEQEQAVVLQYSKLRSALPKPRDVSGTVEKSWNFAKGLPQGWRSEAGIRTRRGASGLLIDTGPLSDSRLISESLKLQNGVYELRVTGAVMRGGLQSGIEDAAGKGCLAANYFAQTQHRAVSLPTNFVVSNGEPVRLSLANWKGPADNASRWSVRHVTIVSGIQEKTAGLFATYRHSASRLSPRTSTMAETAILNSNFVRTVAVPWKLQRGAKSERRATGTLVTTTDRPYEYQLTMSTDLEAGRYSLLVEGSVLNGGLQLGVVDIAQRRWLNHESFWSGQDFRRGSMIVHFEVPAATGVELVLANWVPRGGRSRWLVRGVRLSQALGG
jgi:hypothetical protein